MPRYEGTREQRAIALLNRVQKGPASISDPMKGCPRPTEEELKTSYRLWFETWIEEDLKTLIPELRNLYGRTP